MAGTTDETATAIITDGSYIERLVCHPRLPMIAGLDSARPAVRVWEFGSDGLRDVGAVGLDADEYPTEPWKRYYLVPSVAWHPSDPNLLVTTEAGLLQWTPDGTAPAPGSPDRAGYRHVAFSPDGTTVWASPSSLGDEDTSWQRSDAFDLESGVLRSGPKWDTAVVEHPGGGLVVTLSSDQAETHLLFARSDGGVPARMQIFRKAVIVDVDGYEAPIFSPDGRFLAIRGNAYVHSVDVFEFPSLRKILHTALGDPYPAGVFPYPPEWREEQATWSSHNMAFSPSGSLLLGTPKGTVISVDLDNGRAFEHQVADATIGALAVLSTGHLVISDRSGKITVTAAPEVTSPQRTASETTAEERVASFIGSTTELPEGANWDTEHLVITDGTRTWTNDDLDRVTDADDTDPTWLRLRAALNTFQARQE